jgi:hypothetical protein
MVIIFSLGKLKGMDKLHRHNGGTRLLNGTTELPGKILAIIGIASFKAGAHVATTTSSCRWGTL